MEELKTGPEEVKGKKINRPISLRVRKAFQKRSVESYFSLLETFHKRMNHVFNGEKLKTGPEEVRN